MKPSFTSLLGLMTPPPGEQQPGSPIKLAELERKLDQAASQLRESPERGMFAGDFFPGQRDRGVILFGDLNFTPPKGARSFIGAFNGNRFFADNNRQANYMVRV